MEALAGKLPVKKLWNVNKLRRSYGHFRSADAHAVRTRQPGGALGRADDGSSRSLPPPHCPRRSARGIQSASRNSTSASSHETVGCV
jgi:hypothetical protein